MKQETPQAGAARKLEQNTTCSFALGNELANLMVLPRTLNRRKSDSITQRTLDHAQKFVTAGVMTPEDYASLRATRR